jgi:hypothetical protein
MLYKLGFLGFLGFYLGPFSQVSRKTDLHFQVSKFPGFSRFSVVAQLEQPLETEMQDYRSTNQHPLSLR